MFIITTLNLAPLCYSCCGHLALWCAFQADSGSYIKEIHGDFLYFFHLRQQVLLISSQLPLLLQIQITALRENCELIDIYIFSLLLFYFFFHVVI